ncbi:MAG: alpha/beta hydrolase [Alphaproteobacteria bacterium]
MDQATAPKAETGSVRSADGTTIGYVKLGVGPPVVMAHGALLTHESWMAVAHELSGRFTCYAMDRRGRGLSGDASGYSVEREVEDIQAVLAAAGPGASLIGHSYGGFCSLLTALKTDVSRLVIYEAPWPIHGPAHPMASALCTPLIAQGKNEKAVVAFLQDAGLVPRGPLANLWMALPMWLKAKPMPSWPGLVALAPTVVREFSAVDAVGPSLERFAALKMPVLFLLGTESKQPHIHDTTLELAKLVPKAKLVELKGQGHMAQALAPKLVASEIAAFLSPMTEVA